MGVGRSFTLLRGAHKLLVAHDMVVASKEQLVTEHVELRAIT